MVQPQAPVQPPAKKKGRGLAIALAATGLVVVGAGVAAGLYYFGLGGEKLASVAHAHLPEGCDVVLRGDLKTLMEVKPVKKHVVAALEEVAKEEGGGRLAALLIAARLNPKKDLTELAVCLNDPEGESHYGMIFGGKLLSDSGVITAMDRHDGKDEFEAPRKLGKLSVLEQKKDGALFSQSPADAALLVSDDEELLKSVAKKGNAFEDYDLPLDDELSGVVSSKAIQRLVASKLGIVPGIKELNRMGRVKLTLTLDPGELGAVAEMPDAASATAAVTELQGAIAAATLPFSPVSAEVKEALRGAKVNAKGKELRLTVPISDKTIEKACEDLADEIRERNED